MIELQTIFPRILVGNQFKTTESSSKQGLKLLRKARGDSAAKKMKLFKRVAKFLRSATRKLVNTFQSKPEHSSPSPSSNFQWHSIDDGDDQDDEEAKKSIAVPSSTPPPPPRQAKRQARKAQKKQRKILKKRIKKRSSKRSLLADQDVSPSWVDILGEECVVDIGKEMVQQAEDGGGGWEDAGQASGNRIRGETSRFKLLLGGSRLMMIENEDDPSTNTLVAIENVQESAGATSMPGRIEGKLLKANFSILSPSFCSQFN